MNELTDELGDDVTHDIARSLNIDYGDDDRYIMAFARAIVDADRALQPQDGSWRFAIDQARIAAGLDCTTSADDPVKSLAELIKWEVQIALDPSVSSDAQALIDQGRALREQAQAVQPQGEPAWHPAPNVPGLWISKDANGTYTAWAISTLLIERWYLKQHDLTWYGPIPQEPAL